MILEVIGGLRRPCPFEIGGRGKQALAEIGDAPRHKGGIGQARPDPDRQVEPAFDHVDHPVVERQGQLDIGMGAQKARQKRRQNDLSEGIGGVDAQMAGDCARTGADTVLDLSDGGENVLRLGIIEPPVIGQRHAPRRSGQERAAEAFLQQLDLAA